MGLSTGTPCCGCRIRKWRIAMTANHGYYGNRQPKEFSIVGTAGGFDWLTVTDGFLVGEIVKSYIKMTNLGGDDWRFEIIQNGLGADSIDFTHDFTTGLVDIEVEFAINDNVKQVITIMDFDDTRPSDFLWFPNRSPEDSIRLVYNKFPISPIRLEGQRIAHSTLMTRSTDSDYVYWNATLDGDTHSIRADKQTGAVSHSFVLSSGTPSTDYVQLQYIAWPFHVSLFYTLTGGTTGPFWDGLIFDEDDPPIVEIFEMTELLDEDLEATVYRTDLMCKDQLIQHQWRRTRLQLNQAFLTTDESPWLFDASGIDAIISPSFVNVQQAVIGTAHDEVTVRLTVKAGLSDSYSAYPKTFAVDGDGRFSGTVRFRILSNDIDVSVSGRVVATHVPASYWPDTDEEFSGQFEQTKIWLPEYFSKGRDHDDPSYNWMLTKNLPARLIGKPFFTTHTAPTPTSVPPLYTQPVIAIESGSLPTGMSVSSNLGGTHAELVLNGTPTEDEDGTVQFRIRSSIFKYDGTGSSSGTMEQLDYVSKVYTWIVGDGSAITFTIEYPTPWSNTMTPPDSGFDWRIDGTTAVGTPYTIPATTTGGVTPIGLYSYTGTLPPNALFDTASGAVYTVGLSPLSPNATGSLYVERTDAASNVATSATYNWQYIGF